MEEGSRLFESGIFSELDVRSFNIGEGTPARNGWADGSSFAGGMFGGSMERKDDDEGTDRSTRGFEKTHQVRLIGSISRTTSAHSRHGSDSSLVRPSNVLPR